MKYLYIIAGCNGAGKTTASYTVLPEVLNCDEFVNADEIAKGLSPFNPDKAGIQAGRLMLSRIDKLIKHGLNFAFETTLATKSYKNLVLNAQSKGYKVTLLFLYLESEKLAIERVKIRVREGGHNIPVPVIKRRYTNGLRNFFNIYKNIVDDWIFMDTTSERLELIAQSEMSNVKVNYQELWGKLNKKYNE